MNVEHHRKDAKRLVRAVRDGAVDARTRAVAVIGDQRATRFRLSDALHVIAHEQGYRSWPELKRAVEERPSSMGPVPSDPDRAEITIDTGLEYRPGDPVRVRVIRRGSKTSVSDDGAAFARAGRPPAWRQAATRVEHEFIVNFSRGGAISLPVVPVGPPEDAVVRRIAEASRAFYQELLELA